MINNSTYATNLIHFTPEGDLPSNDDAEHYLQRLVSCLSAGAARAILDSTRHIGETSDEPEIYVDDCPTPAEGWELDALDDEIRTAVEWTAKTLFTSAFHDVITLANWLAFENSPTEDRPLWFHDFGMALYRCGNLLGYKLIGKDIGFTDYHNASAYRLDDWMSLSGLVGAIETWIDTSEEPCILHGSVYQGMKNTMAENPDA
jgi:hypothetical protein